MHADICKFPNEHFYSNQLVTPSTVVRDISPFVPYRIFSLYSRTNINHYEDQYANLSEVDFVLLITNLILQRSRMNIGIITPYSKQKKLFQTKFDIMMK